MPQPYLTAALPGVGGRYKVLPDDFKVAEIPLYEPCGEGEHTYFEIEKRGLSTFDAVNALARALKINSRRIGYAGLKDAQAVTRQTLSVQQVSLEAVLAVEVPDIKILWAKRHTNKLKRGHLRGNKFTLRIRGVPKDAAAQSERILHLLARRGVPNYFGEQRFGMRGNTHILGEALVRQDAEAFMRAFLGAPDGAESPRVWEARRLFEAREWQEAYRSFPRNMRNERNALKTLIEKEDYDRAVRSIPKKMRKFFISAFQSHLFNQVLAARLDTLDLLQVGDLAYKHDSGAVFRVIDAKDEQPRADKLEISPSGPLFGYKMIMPEGAPGELEQRVLAEAQVTLEDFRVPGGLATKGGRRPLRFPLADVAVWYDNGVMLSFSLPSGCYATNVLDEVMKNAAQ